MRVYFFGALAACQSLVAYYGYAPYDEFEMRPIGVFDDDRVRFYGEVDYLAWCADQEGLPFGKALDVNTTLNDYSGGLPPSGFLENSFSYSERNLYFRNHWDSGVRASAGFKPKCWDWDLSVVYTYFNTHKKHRELSSAVTSIVTEDTFENLEFDVSGTALLPNFFQYYIPEDLDGNNTTVFTLHPRWKLNFNQVDLECSRELALGFNLILRPFGGVRGLWTTQKFDETFTITSTNTVDGLFDAYQYDLKARNQFHSVGPKAGLDLCYSLGGGLDLTASLAGSVLWGYFNVLQSYTSMHTIPHQGTAYGQDTIHQSHHTHIFNCDVSFGMQWHAWLNCRKNLLSIRFAWEQHLYTNTNQLQDFGSDPFNSDSVAFEFTPNAYVNNSGIAARGDLILSGFTAGIAFLY